MIWSVWGIVETVEELICNTTILCWNGMKCNPLVMAEIIDAWQKRASQSYGSPVDDHLDLEPHCIKWIDCPSDH